MIHKVGNGPWMITVQAATHSYDVVISDDMAHTITMMIVKAIKEAKKVDDEDQT